LSQWLHAGLVSAGFDAVLLETRHVKAALSAMTVKTDRRDARGIAQLLRMGWYRPVHVKTLPAQEVRAMLVARKQLLGKLVDVELSIRGLLRNFGLKVGKVTRKEFEGRVRELAQGQPSLELIADAMLAARNVLLCQFTRLHNAILQIVRKDDVCARLMSIPGVGALTALTFRTAIDDPTRIAKSRDVGPLFGLTPRRYQSGETDVMGRISKAGDGMVRTALYEAANSMLTRSQRMSALKAWALNVASGSNPTFDALALRLR
jgi:transposase